jgi:glycerophosphoryl diester phosphodiesterase
VIECDVHLTTDQRLAVIHDHSLERTTNGKGLVGRHTMAELKQLDAGGGERIPELVEVLDLARGRVGVAVEIKSLPVLYPGLEQVLVEQLRAAAMVADVVVISFDHRTVRLAKQIEPELVVGTLVAGRPLLLAELLAFADAEVYSPHWSFVDEDTVEEVHGAGAAVGVWTVDEAWVLEHCRGLGVDAIYTNKPRAMLAALGRGA